jgi:hypothetical protein
LTYVKVLLESSAVLSTLSNSVCNDIAYFCSMTALAFNITPAREIKCAALLDGLKHRGRPLKANFSKYKKETIMSNLQSFKFENHQVGVMLDS